MECASGQGGVQAVESMRLGMTPTAAAEDAMSRILAVVPDFQGALVAMNATGSHGGAAVGWVFHYAVADRSTRGEPAVLQVLPMAASGPARADSLSGAEAIQTAARGGVRGTALRDELQAIAGAVRGGSGDVGATGR